MKKLLAAAMILASGMVFGQQDQNSGKTEDTQPAATKQTDVSSENKTIKKDAGSIEGKSFKIKLTARTGSEKNNASASGSASRTSVNDERNKKENGGNLSQPMNISTGNTGNIGTPATGQEPAGQGISQNQNGMNSSQQTDPNQATGTQKIKEEHTLPPANSSSNQNDVNSQPNSTPGNQSTMDNAPGNTDQPSSQPGKSVQPGLDQNNSTTGNQNVNQNTSTGVPGNDYREGTTQANDNDQDSKDAMNNNSAMDKSFENKTIIITLKNGTVDITGDDDMKFESCPYQVTSGSGSLVTFTASCKNKESGNDIWWSGFIDGDSIRGSLLTKAAEGTDYTFKGSKTSSAKKRVHEKETSLR